VLENMVNQKIKKLVHWIFAIVTIIFILTGFGITEYRLVEQFTFGLLTKSLSFEIHTLAWPFFVILFVAHIFLAVGNANRKK
jgi:cytochrome b subunit of formate dehydrogenase